MTTIRKHAPPPASPPDAGLLSTIEAYIQQYVVFGTPAHAFVAALWVLATYLWQSFDAFPYLVISSPVKRSGKTRFSEVLDFLVANGRRFTAATMGSIYAAIKEQAPVIFLDEAETLSREDASGMRAILNAGYRKGATVPRWSRQGVVEWPVYCPKVFILIGDVFDTLRDRAILIEMWRGEPPQRFSYQHAKAEGNALGVTIQAAVQAAAAEIVRRYETTTLAFLQDRDEELWLPLFAVCRVVAPEREKELARVAIDLATLKTQEKRTYRELVGAETKAQQDEYARHLLRDLYAVMDGTRFVYTKDAVTRLQAIDTAPWRTYNGEGINDYNLADLLKPLGVAPRLIKSGTKRAGTKVARGYRRDEVEKALKKL